MRKLMVAVAAVAGLALTAGCKRNEPQEERRDLAEAQRDAQKDIAEARKDANEDRADIQREEQEEIAEAQRDVAEERQDVAEADRERAGAAMMNDTVQGRVRSTFGDSLVLSVPAKNNAELKLKTDDKTRVTRNNLAVELDDFKEGTEVRASYVMDGDDLVARDVVIINPVMEK